MADEAVTLRPFRQGDMPALVEVINRAREVDQHEERVTLDSVRHQFDTPGRVPESDCMVAATEHGRVVGYCNVVFESENTQVWLQGGVDPEFRRQGVGRRLVRAAETRIAHTARGPVTVYGFVSDQNVGVAALLRSMDYAEVRASYRMRINLGGPVEPPTLPGDLTLRSFVRERDARAVYEADQEAFLGHWGYDGEPFEVWAHHRFESDLYDPALWLVAVDGEQIAGICLCEVHGASGWVNIMGVRVPWRRRGLGMGLLLHSFAMFQSQGYNRVELGVDAGNTSAVALYEQAGMIIQQCSVIYGKTVGGLDSSIR